MDSSRQNILNILQLNLAVLIISTSGVLGRYIELPPPVTIFFRTLAATAIFYIFLRIRKQNLKFENRRDLLNVILAGVFLCLHWTTYFYSLRLSNVAIGLLSLFTYPVITAFLEPLILKTGFKKVHLALGVLVLTGVYFLTPDIDFQNSYFIAVLFGIVSAVFYSLRNIIMKPKIQKYNGSVLMLYQIATVCVCLIPAAFYADIPDVIGQWKPLLVLAILTTCIGHTLFLMSFRNFSITTASIMSSIQPVYGILLGVLFLDEIPGMDTIIGGALIISAVIIESLLSFKKT